MLPPDHVPPVIVQEIQPDYPPEAMQAQIEGSVEIECIVETNGTCSNIQVVKSLDPMWLDQEAIMALQQWRFTPGKRMGEPVPVVVRIEFRFDPS